MHTQKLQVVITAAWICNVCNVVTDTQNGELCVTQRQSVDSRLPWSSLFSMPNGLSLPHTIPHISSYPAPLEPPWPPLQWHIKATLLSQQPETPLIHQAPWVSSLPSFAYPHTPLRNNERQRKFPIKKKKKRLIARRSRVEGRRWRWSRGSFSKWE